MGARSNITDSDMVYKLRYLNSLLIKLRIAKEYAGTINALEEKIETLRRELIKELEDRDVVQRGNFGWEARSINFLLSLLSEQRKQVNDNAN